MAFSADEVRVLRRALAHALYPVQLPPTPSPLAARVPQAGPLWAEDVQEVLWLAEAIDEAAEEGGRLRTFLLADLIRYRVALPGSVRGYLKRLEEAVTAGYLPGPEDLAALRSLSRLPSGPAEHSRRTRLLGHCHALAEAEVRARLSTGQRHLVAVPSPASEPRPAKYPIPVGGRIPMSNSPGTPKPTPAGRPQPHRMPTPAELFGHRPKPTQPEPKPEPPAEDEHTDLATGTG